VDLKKVLTVDELAELLRVQPQVVYREVKKGGIPCFYVGAAIRFSTDVIAAWMDNSAKHRSRQLYENTVPAASPEEQTVVDDAVEAEA